jgi:molybdopterin molybdotransferase
MITVKEAKELVRLHTPEPRIRLCSLSAASTGARGGVLAKVLAQDVLATEPSPRFTNSAMDGVAVRFAADRTEYTIIGESAAGKPFAGVVQAGEGVRISTGAALPQGADTVIPREEYDVSGAATIILKKNSDSNSQSNLPATPVFAKVAQWVRHAGSEYAAGACVLKQGTVLRPAHIALAAQLGLQELPVFDAPRVALLATGSELLQRSADTQESNESNELSELSEQRFTIFDANTPMLQAAVRDAGGEVVLARHVEDRLEATIDALSEALHLSDIICTTGGVSVGEYDFVRTAAETLGFETIFWRVRQKPGKPLLFAKRGSTLLFGLPGNPVSTLMCFLHYVQPVMASMLGRASLSRWRTVTARMSTALVSAGGRAEFVRVRLEAAPEPSDSSSALVAVPLAKQESFMLTSLTEADGFVFLDIDAEMYEGALVDVMLF